MVMRTTNWTAHSGRYEVTAMTQIESIVEDLEQQLVRGLALVATARDAMLDSGARPDSVAATLLDMAEDELSDLRLVRQVKAHVAA